MHPASPGSAFQPQLGIEHLDPWNTAQLRRRDVLPLGMASKATPDWIVNSHPSTPAPGKAPHMVPKTIFSSHLLRFPKSGRGSESFLAYFIERSSPNLHREYFTPIRRLNGATYPQMRAGSP
jgi:hypothetical protein